MENKIRILLLLCSCLTFNYAYSQQAVKGTVSTSPGTPVIGATVQLKGTGVGTVTDADGSFTINAPQNSTLIISSLGLEKKEVTVKGEVLHVVLQSSTNELDEVVIAGAVFKKQDLTGAISSVSADQIAATPTTDINQAIQGKLTGAYVKSNAQPGSDASIRIRGYNSIEYGTNPIFVVDGVIIDGGFNTLNPDDIASVEVLKDASATAIYGSRGANGVVIVTTKKGKSGVGKITYNTWVGWQTFSNKLNLMNAHDLYNLRVDAYANAYMDKNPTADRLSYINRYLTSDTSIAFAKYEQDTYEQGKSYDWLNAVTRTGIQQNHTLGFSGGGEKGTYYLSLNYTDQKGIIKNSSYKRFGGRLNIDHHVKPWLEIGTNTAFTRTIQDVTDGSVFSVASTANPLLPIDTAGLYYLKWADVINEDQYNPLRSLEIQNNQYSNRILSSSYLNVTPVQNLNIRSTISIDFIHQQQYQYTPTTTGQDQRNSYHGSAVQYKAENTNWQWDNTATYTKHFGQQSLTAMIGTSLQENTSNYDQVNAYGFPNDAFAYKYLGGAYSKDKTVLASDFVTTTMMSYFARVQYSYGGKYFATGTVRYDGSSKFGQNHKWGAFPSLALAWDMSQENFMKGINWINQLKWRADYGIAGNQNIPNYAYYSLYRPNYTNGTVTYTSDGRRGNPDLRWERQKQLNFGLDLGVLHNRLTLTFDYFNITNDDLLMDETLTTVSGFTNTVANVGALKNKGIEVNLNYAIVRRKDLQWNFNLNVSSDKNKITKLYGDTKAIYNKGGYTGVDIQRTGNLFLGQSLNTIYALKFDKIAQQSDMAGISDIDFGGRTVHPGDILPVDKNGDKVINDDDRYVVGTTDPKFYGGFGTDVSYKGFGLNLFFTYSYGLKRISGLYEGLISSAGMSAASEDMLNRWTPDNTHTNIPRAVYGISRFNPGDTNLGVQDASFLRLSVFTLSYSIPEETANAIHLDNAKIYLTGSNMLLLTKDKGYDPETGDSYPNSRTITVGLNVTL
jgi:TonB-linked SusC/RagA family outer membrane protein